MAHGDSTEVIVLDLGFDAMRARREKVEALRTLKYGTILKTVLGALLLLAATVVLFALLRR
jgi:hypothetical protein